MIRTTKADAGRVATQLDEAACLLYEYAAHHRFLSTAYAEHRKAGPAWVHDLKADAITCYAEQLRDYVTRLRESRDLIDRPKAIR